MNSTEIVFADCGALVCRYLHWVEMVHFAVFNYGLHAVTVHSTPGEGNSTWVFNMLWGLFLPLVGAFKAIPVIYRCASLEREPLKIALRAGALCMVYDPNANEPNASGNNWAPSGERTSRNNFLPIDLTLTKVQGEHSVEPSSHSSPGYFYPQQDITDICLVTVPGNYMVLPQSRTDGSKIHIAYNYNSAKMFAAIAQILYACYQLSETSQPQIVKFGYAAYQLTIIPYAIMSLINLIAALCQPEFPTMLLVHQGPPVTPEAQAGGGGAEEASPTGENRGIDTEVQREMNPTTGGIENEIYGAVGVVVPVSGKSVDLHTSRRAESPKVEFALCGVCALIMIGAILGPYLIIWLLTDFNLGQTPVTVSFWSGSAPPPKPPKMPNQLVLIWITYGQVVTLGWMIEKSWSAWFSTGVRRREVRQLMVFLRKSAITYLFCGILVSTYGGYKIRQVMADDKICVKL